MKVIAIWCIPSFVAMGTLLVVLVRAAGAVCPSCPGDLNGDNSVTVGELVRAVNSLLDGCPPPAAGSNLLQTGQMQCDQGNGLLASCPGSPAGQDAAAHAGIPFNYTDNGDGTLSDIVSGLMWEKIVADGSVHDVNKTYTWYGGFNMKIAALNTDPCFAGHCDWRMPNRRELDSLVDAGRVAPSIDPAFNTACTPGCVACSCTRLGYYWSSTSYQDLAAFAWAVDFNVGIINAFDKGSGAPIQYAVRAVRSGL